MYHVIINPASRSGKGNRVWQELETVLKEEQAQYTAHFTTQAGDAKRFVEQLTGTDTDEITDILVMGGDGTLNESLQGIRNLEKTHLYYLPIGSGNDYGRDFPEKGKTVQRLRRMLREPHEYHTDIGAVRYRLDDGREQMRYFAVSCGIGFDAAVCAEVNESAWKPRLNKIGLGKLVYLIVALRNLMNVPQNPCKLTIEDEHGEKAQITRKSIIFAAAMNHKYEGGGFMFAPQADAEDGLLDLCLVDNMPKLKILRVIPTAFKGKHVRYKEVHIHRAKRIHIATDDPMYLHADGEVPGKTKELTVLCLKQALTLYM